LQASTVVLLEKAIVSAEEEPVKGLDSEISAAKKKLSDLQAAEAKTKMLANKVRKLHSIRI